ncbi:MAG: RNA polymerase sigma factor [Myxococcota bacterium]|nr:RNA polymerase sigma factor [Myxococcota bacterium]
MSDQIPSKVLPMLTETHRRFLAFVEARVGSRADAEEILQSAFVRGMESAATVRKDESVMAWFYRILRNAIIDHYRRRGTEQHALDRFAREMPDDASDAPADLQDDICACVGDLVRTLKPGQKEILQRVDLDDGTVHSFAAMEGITAGSARVRLHRARQALRERVQTTCGTCAEHGCLNCTCRRAPTSSS